MHSSLHSYTAMYNIQDSKNIFRIVVSFYCFHFASGLVMKNKELTTGLYEDRLVGRYANIGNTVPPNKM